MGWRSHRPLRRRRAVSLALAAALIATACGGVADPPGDAATGGSGLDVGTPSEDAVQDPFPTPKPEPTPDPQPAPTPEDPQPAPTPEPPDPQPAPTPEPPDPEPAPTPEPEPEEATPPGPVYEAQERLAALGYPVGPVDDLDGPLTRRGLCTWRRIEGHDVARGPLRDGELDLILASEALPPAPEGRGVVVDRTCQALYLHEGGSWQLVVPASTGADGLPSPGEYRIQWFRPGWHTSTLYPAPEPNMYDAAYFAGAIAIHGSHHVPPRPASAGCVRVTPTVADDLLEPLEVGDPVAVIGRY